MNRISKRLMSIALKKAGCREVYAMHHGKPHNSVINGKNYIVFTYSEDEPYQDANGAKFCVTDCEWVD